MATRTIETKTELNDYIEDGGFLGMGVLVRDGAGDVWIGYETEADGPYVLRPINEDDVNTLERPLRPFLNSELTDLPLPLYVTTEDRLEPASVEKPAQIIRVTQVHLLDGETIEAEPHVYSGTTDEDLKKDLEFFGEIIGSADGALLVPVGDGKKKIVPSRQVRYVEYQDTPERGR